MSTTRRSDIRAAAEPLRKYWVEIAVRSDRIGQRGGKYFPTVRFLRDCLTLVDETVTESLLLEIDK